MGSRLAAAGFSQRVVRNGWTLWEDPKPLPRVRWEQQTSDPNGGGGINWIERVNSIDIMLNQSQGRKLELAFAASPDLQVCVQSACNPIQSSGDGLIHVDVPRGTTSVRLVYRNSLLGPSICIALLTAGILSFLALRARSDRVRLN